MNIIISNTGGTPIYEQIIIQLKQKIITGELPEGTALPSMRLLAKELRISVITTKRAYEELERQGFIESYTGKGSFVKAKDTELFKEESLRQIEEFLTSAVSKAQLCGIDENELCEIIKIIYREDR
jgi:GntR family transcriptional regulator